MLLVRLFLKGIHRIIEFFIGGFILYFLLASILAFIPVNLDENKDGTIPIFVSASPIHTDIVIPAQIEKFSWYDFVPRSDFPEAIRFDYIRFGWGDQGFYIHTPTWDDLTPGTVMNALFWPSSAAMHVAYESQPVESEMVRKKMISVEAYLNLVDFIKSSFYQDEQKVALIPNKGYSYYDNFYEANGSYHLFNTCNSWTNAALKIVGIRTSLYALSTDGIMRHL